MPVPLITPSWLLVILLLAWIPCSLLMYAGFKSSSLSSSETVESLIIAAVALLFSPLFVGSVCIAAPTVKLLEKFQEWRERKSDSG